MSSNTGHLAPPPPPPPPGDDETGFQTAFTEAAAQDTPQSDPAPEPPAQATPDPPAPDPVPEPAPQPTPPTVEPTTPSDIALAASQAGFEVDGLSDVEIAQQMASQYTSAKPYEEYGRMLAAESGQIQEYFAEKNQPAAAAPAPEPAEEWSQSDYFKKIWNAPQWDEQYTLAQQNGMVQRSNETGLWEAAPGYELMAAPILQGMNAAQQFTQQKWQDITQGNPYEQFYNVLEEPIKRAMQAQMETMLDERMSQRDSRSSVDDFEAQNAEWLYTQDKKTGQRMVTEQGQAFYDEIKELQDAGVSDPGTLMRLASRHVNGQQQQAPPQEQQVAPPATPAQAQQTASAASVGKQESFLTNALEKAQHAPSSGGFAQATPDDPVNVSENELNNMFVSDFSKAGVSGP